MDTNALLGLLLNQGAPGLVTALLVGGIAASEIYGSLAKNPDAFRLCRRHLAMSWALFGLFGYASYLATLFIRFPVEADPGKNLTIALGAVAFAQTGRIEIRQKADLAGGARTPSDRESFYTRWLRWRKAGAFIRLLRGLDQDRLEHLLVCGLEATYELDDLENAAVLWIQQQPVECRPALEDEVVRIRKSAVPPKKKRNVLVLWLIEHTLATARMLAEHRAEAIIDKGAVSL